MTVEEYIAAVRKAARELSDLLGEDMNDSFLEDLYLLAHPEGDAWTDDDLRSFWLANRREGNLN